MLAGRTEAVTKNGSISSGDKLLHQDVIKAGLLCPHFTQVHRGSLLCLSPSALLSAQHGSFTVQDLMLKVLEPLFSF